MLIIFTPMLLHFLLLLPPLLLLLITFVLTAFTFPTALTVLTFLNYYHA